MTNPYRVYNHTDRELIVATDEDGEQTYCLLGQCVSPLDVKPRLLRAASEDPIDGYRQWKLAEGFDVHVSETTPGLPVVEDPRAPAELHISGLGIEPVRETPPDPGETRPSPTSTVPGDSSAPAPRAAWFYREDEIWVTVLGAGITGLTVAHELVTRGFRVQVIERAHGSPADVRNLDRFVEDARRSAASAPSRSDDDREVLERLERFRRGLATPDVGGIARTQWGTQPLGHAAAPIAFEQARAISGAALKMTAIAPTEAAASSTSREPARLIALRSVHGDAVWFGRDRGGPQEMRSAGAKRDPQPGAAYHAFGITWTGDQIDPFAGKLDKWLNKRGTQSSLAAVQLVVIDYRRGGADHVDRAYKRLYAFLDLMREGQEEEVKALRKTLARLEVLPTARIDVDEQEPASGQPYVGLYVRVHEDLGLIAGEHGFRFFPAFYRHLRDTMRRTPIFDPITRTFTPRTTHDNLQEVRWQVVADPRRHHRAALSRKAIPTIGGMIEQYRAIRRDLGYRPIDLLRFWLRLLRYMTSSTRRREADYEGMSWWDFVSKRRLDDPADPARFEWEARFEEALKHAPKTLVAMGSEHADARTQGNISVQLLMDHFEPQEQSDSTLAGPTSTTWFDHWRTYLEAQGVRFFLGEVTSIDVEPNALSGSTPPRARVAITFPGGEPPAEYLDGEDARERKAIREHYIVSALDVVGLAQVTRALRRSKRAVGAIEDLDDLVGDARGRDRDLEDIRAVGRRGADDGLGDRFQTLTGIQLYYQRHVSFANGHIYFAGSPWCLSAISQIQFWGPFGSGRRGRLAGNLSVDIGSWRASGKDKDPNDLDRDEIAARVQEQIKNSSKPLDGERQAWMPLASLYHLDDHIAFARVDPAQPDAVIPWRNHAPFLINIKGEWDQRPRGEPWTPNDLAARDRRPGAGEHKGEVWTPDGGGYVVHHGNLVVAGPHMRTFTRITTMEAANESARHAVNAILDHATWVDSHARGEREEPLHAEKLKSQSPERRESPPRPIFRRTDGPSVNVVRSTTRFGDYCDIWDPEQFEFEDLGFLRSIDEHLVKAGDPGGDAAPAPHLFDILRIDELPELHLRMRDNDVVRILKLVGGVLDALAETRLVELPSITRVVDRAHEELARLFERESADGRRGSRVSPRGAGRTSRRSRRDE